MTPRDYTKPEIQNQEAPEKPVPVQKTQTRRVYNCVAVNMRSEPTTESKVVAVVRVDTSVTLIQDTRTGWSKVSFENYEGYIMNDYLTK